MSKTDFFQENKMHLITVIFLQAVSEGCNIDYYLNK